MENIFVVELKDNSIAKNNNEAEPGFLEKFFVDKKYDYSIKNKIIGIYYNIEENGFYYRVNDEYTSIRKDLVRSLEMIEEIIKRLLIFNYKIIKVENRIDWFIRKIIDNFNGDISTYLLIGSSPYEYEIITDIFYRIFELDDNITDESSSVYAIIGYMQHKLKLNTNYNITYSEILKQSK